MKRVLIDSDVVLDFFFDRQPFSEHAAAIFHLCETKIIEGNLTPVIVSNVYYVLRQTAKHELVVEKLLQLLSITEILVTNKQTLLEALHSNFSDFEDAIQNFSAEKDGSIDVILTRNLKDYKNSQLAIMTPESYLKARENRL